MGPNHTSSRLPWRAASLSATVLSGALIAAGGAAATPAHPLAGACHAGVHPFGGVQARTFCGPASVHITAGGHSFTISGGQCQRTSQYVAVNIGTAVLGTTKKPRPDYFGLDVGRTPGGGTPASHDGTFPGFALTYVKNHQGTNAVKSTVTLSGGRTRGTFTGTLITGGSVSGSFRCS